MSRCAFGFAFGTHPVRALIVDVALLDRPR